MASTSNEGIIQCKMVASDGYDSVSDSFNFQVFDANSRISNQLGNLVSAKNASVGSFFSFQAKAFQNDDGPKALTYNAFFENPDGSLTELTTSGNTWLLFNDVTLTFSGTSLVNDNDGVYNIVFQAFDGSDLVVFFSGKIRGARTRVPFDECKGKIIKFY